MSVCVETSVKLVLLAIIIIDIHLGMCVVIDTLYFCNFLLCVVTRDDNASHFESMNEDVFIKILQHFIRIRKHLEISPQKKADKHKTRQP